ncbi:hypothetical protein KI387_042126, partial [Taxus chinensis]
VLQVVKIWTANPNLGSHAQAASKSVMTVAQISWETTHYQAKASKEAFKHYFSGTPLPANGICASQETYLDSHPSFQIVSPCKVSVQGCRSLTRIQRKKNMCLKMMSFPAW